MKTIFYFSIFLSLLICFGCQSSTKQSTSDDTIPAILNRAHLIGPEEEMGFMLNQYAKLADHIKANPKDFESKLSLAELFMMEARISGEHGHYYPAALQVINDVLSQELKDPIMYRALLDKSSVLLSLHQFAEAKEIGEKALQYNSYSADIYGVLVDANVEMGDYDKAIAYADKMVSIRPDLRSYSRVSYLREIHGMVDESIVALKMAVAAGYPGMEQTDWARLTLGHLYERYGSLDSAMMQYATALAERPNYPFAIAAMAKTYAAMGKPFKADSLNEVARNLIPEVSFFVDKATWEKSSGNTSVANNFNREILEMMADDEKAGHKMGLELAKVYFNLIDDTDKALSYALTEYKTRPDNIDVNKILAEIYYAKGDQKKTKEHLQKALVTGSKDPELKCLEGLMMAKSSEVEAGAKLIKSVFVETPYLDCSFCKEARSIIL
jgi:tetratricopeptide (TPR) repeat protein